MANIKNGKIRSRALGVTGISTVQIAIGIAERNKIIAAAAQNTVPK
jgi:hypothetical protein